MKIGYLGVGNIATCMIEGFCGLDQRHHFFLSPRSARNSAYLADKYINISVCDSNQHVVDESETVFISMLANGCLDTLKGLNFRNDQKIINLVATIPPEDIREVIGRFNSYSHIVPLPYVKACIGPIAAFPESDWLLELLSPIGTVVFAKSMNDIRTMQAITALMSSFFEMLHHLMLFADNEGLARKEAVAYTASFFSSLCSRAENSASMDLHELALDMTPGGLNELALKTLNEYGAIKAWGEVMFPVMKRIKPE